MWLLIHVGPRWLSSPNDKSPRFCMTLAGHSRPCCTQPGETGEYWREFTQFVTYIRSVETTLTHYGTIVYVIQRKKTHMIASTIRGGGGGGGGVVATKDTPHKLILNSNLTKCRLFITYFAVVKSFWNFAQSMTISLSCSGKMSKWFVVKNVIGERDFPDIWI